MSDHNPAEVKPRSVIWKSPAGRERLVSSYEHFLAKTDSDVDRLNVPASIGSSHVLVTGRVDAPPLVCLHGMRTGSSFLLSELTRLGNHFRLFVPDMPGQSVYGPDVRLSVNDNAFATWLIDVIDGLELNAVNLFGVSWGAWVARLTASMDPSRVSTLTLLCPAGISNGSHITGLVKMVPPLLRHKLWPTEQSLRSLVRPIMTTWDGDWAGAFDRSLRDMKMDTRIPPLASDDALRRLPMPTLVIAGEDDISFPGSAVVSRARRLMPNVETELLKNCKHCPPTTEEFRTWLAERISTFIRDAPAAAK